jgi:DNA-binding beta-propeller fold protein YncE
MIQDPADASLYISYQINGSGFVSRLDPITGEVSKTRHLSGFPFAQNIKVNNGKIYFTCSLRADQSSINLYSINFE